MRNDFRTIAVFGPPFEMSKGVKIVQKATKVFAKSLKNNKIAKKRNKIIIIIVIKM